MQKRIGHINLADFLRYKLYRVIIYRKNLSISYNNYRKVQ